MVVKLQLQELGLDSYESAAYVTLVQTGISTAHIVSKESGVPYGKIYPVLAGLEKKGFVKTFEGVPKRFVAVEPKIAIEKSIDDKKKAFENLKNKSQKIIETLGKFSSRKPNEPLEAIRILEGYKNYLKLSILLHKEAKEEWLSITRLEIYNEHYNATKECIKRGMKVRLLTFKDEDKKRVKLWRRIGVEVRFIEYVPTHFSVIDNQQVTIRILGEEKYLALWIRNKTLANYLHAHFEMLWKNADN